MSAPETACLSDEMAFDYWTGDVDPSTRDRIEAHMFECAACAARVGEADVLLRTVRTLVRQGRVRGFVTDETLNRLAHDGARVRGYTIGPGATLHCAVWDDDDVVVTRLRADLAGIGAVDIAMRLESGELLEQATDIPVAADARELVMMLPASLVRRIPAAPVHLMLTASGPASRVVAEYVFDHQGGRNRQS